MKNQLFKTNLIALVFFATTAQAATTYRGTDTNGNPCGLLVTQDIAPQETGDAGQRLEGEVVTSYSKTEFKIFQNIHVDETGHVSLSPELKGALADEHQGEVISVKVSKNLEPVSFTYFNNKGFRYFNPINVRCALNK